ncbi:ubiquitin-like protein Pup [Dermacoccus nishinomiyaensis]|uniref:ubiquitin-like protein Pup n=1 Tax=Dermacoccus TaxID=57495 RepID=UPI0001E642AA|nr:MULTISPECIES: ubiquitin-like protein Pup [Dermacoccus]HCQ17828.1 ubiquitin-like protein Pup [Dermacoccus sp.]EFP56833.1 ubiquitin-like protein Pup [Dermacoccus sp. Ellin185]MCT1605106.1 ubiquitin-like protein Pup [Dermacoccus nishinomiyaensis]QQY23563.1 ubiquitin-like protein Pup [Dermacoccus nishinomiyaensis]STD15160.1 Bacterial ubiquitin-like modifier [Dermacoccus nishinomiyaensis]
MSGQQFKNASGKGDDEFEAGADAGQVQAASSTSDIDSMLDEIDGVLETNASEFVSGFVQKGGE